MLKSLRALLPVGSIGLLAMLALAGSLIGAPLTPGNLVIYRMGDGAAALGANGTAVFLDEYTTAGALVQSIPVPTATVGAQRRLVCSGTATTEGFLTRSTNGQFVVLSGYDAAVGTASITTSASATVPRVIGRLAANGTLDTTTALTDAISGGNPRGAASTNGTDLWLSGTSTGGGVRYATLGATTSTSLATTPTNLRVLGIFGGQLYTSSQSGAFRLATIGTGTPTTAGQTITNLPGFPTATGSPIGFFFADLDATVAGVDTVYVADDGGTIQKYSLVGGNWTANGTIALATARGLTGVVSGSSVTLYVTARTTLRTLTDTSGYNATITGTVTTLATAPTNTAFQGVAFSPVGAVLPNLTVNDVSLNEGNAGTTSFTFTVSLSAPAGPGGVTFDIATSDGTAQDDNPVAEDNDYVAKSLLAQTIPAGSSTYSFTVLVNGDTAPETNETFFVTVTNVTGAMVTDGQGQGTIVNDDAAPNLTINDVSLNEGNAGTTTFTFTVSLSAPAGAGGVTFDIATSDGTAQDDNPVAEDNDYVAKSLTGQTIPAGSSTYTFDVLVNGDLTPETNETFFVNISNVTNAIATDGQGQGTIVNDDITKIHDVQGNGAATPIPGATVTVEGVVVANFQGAGKLQGFFLEEEDADFDADPATSEGIFIFCGGCPTPVAEGQRVRATGTVSEFNNMTEITASTAPSVLVTDAANHLGEVTPAPIDLPIAGDVNTFYEAREGMKVAFVDTLTVSEYFELGRFGQILLYEGGRPRQFTEANPPSVAGFAAHLDNLTRREVILDDDNNVQQWYLTTSSPPGPADGLQYVYHPRANGGLSVGTQGPDFFRGGDLVNGLTGVLHWSFPGFGADAWRIRPTAANLTSFTVANPRPATPPTVGGAIKVAGMNLLNYFTTIDTTASTSTGPCGPSGTLDCRGADSTAELTRQRERASIVICTLNADIYAFGELENTTPSATITDLLGAVNTRCGGIHPYAAVNTGGTLGTDAIRVQEIYRTGIVSPVGSPLSDLDPVHNRPPTAQTFDVVDAANPAFGQRFTVVANHFKSKGCPGTGADDDLMDGQSCFNGTRVAQANRLLAWINSTVVPAAGDPDILLLGDFNSYAKEDPITALAGGGYTDLETLFHGANAYSYLFDGQLGHLDYGLSSTSLTPQVAGADAWHINADEVPLFDYSDEIRDSPGEAVFEEKPDGSALVPPRVVFQPLSPYRAADHDPVVVGLFQVADVSVTKTDSPDPVTAGGTLTYTITVTNNGPDTAPFVSWSDPLPAGTTFVSLSSVAGWSCSTPTPGSGGAIICTKTSVAVGSSVFTLTLTVVPSVPSASILTNTATVMQSINDGNAANNTATTTTTVVASADLSVTKTDSPDPVSAGTVLFYTITVSNAGPSDASGVVLSDPLPAGTTFVSATPPAGWSCTTPAVGANGTVSCSTSALAPAGSAVINVNVQVDPGVAAGTVLSNTATVAAATSDPSPGNNSATATTTVQVISDLSVSKVDTPDPVSPGANLTYTITVNHLGVSNATSVSLSDTLPAGTTFVSLSSPAGWSCTTPAVGAGGTVSCSAASLATGGSAVFTLVVAVGPSVASGTVLSNTATVTTANDPNPADNSATATTTVGAASADLAVTKVDTPDPVTAGSNLTYTITATNAGPSVATSAALSDTLPAGTAFVSLSSPAGWSCTTPAVGAGGAVSCTNPSLGVGSAVFTLTVAVGPSVAMGTVITNTATVSSATADPNAPNGSATATTTVAAASGLSITKTDGPDPVNAGSDLTYTITVTNAGPSNAAAATVSDPLPAGTTFVSTSAPAGWSCTSPAVGAGGTVSCSNASVAVGSGVITIVVHVGPSFAPNSTISNTATLSSTTDAPVAAQQTSASSTTTVLAPSSVTATKTFAGQLFPGSTVTYTVTLHNAGPADQANNPEDELVDVLPAELTLVSATASSGTATATVATNTVTWNGVVPAGGNVVITIVATINAGIAEGTIISNQATVQYDADGNGSNEASRPSDDPAAAGADNPTAFPVTGAPPVSEIPTLDGLGLAFLVLLLALGGAAMLRRRAALR